MLLFAVKLVLMPRAEDDTVLAGDARPPNSVTVKVTLTISANVMMTKTA